MTSGSKALISANSHFASAIIANHFLLGIIDDDNYSEHNYNLFFIFSLKTVIEIIVYSAVWRSYKAAILPAGGQL